MHVYLFSIYWFASANPSQPTPLSSHLPLAWQSQICFLYVSLFCFFQFSSVTQSCLTLCDPRDSAHQAPLFSTFSRNLLRFMYVESMMLSNHLILCCPRLLLPSMFPSIRVFSNELALHQVAKVLELQLQKQSFQ